MASHQPAETEAIGKSGHTRTPSLAMDHYRKRLSALKKERSSFITHYRELSDYGHPVKGRFFTQDRNKGKKRYQNIINSKGLQALQVARSGMLSGAFPKSRPWFSFETIDEQLMEDGSVKLWLNQVEKILRRVLADSNFYSQASNMLSELILFGTGCMSHVDDFNDVARFYTHTAGSYMISQNDRFEVDTMVREFEWNVGQIVRAFGLENVSHKIKNAWKKGEFDGWYSIVHFVEPNNEFDGRAGEQGRQNTNMKFKSVYFEADQTENKFLREAGFDEFPGYVIRWDVVGEDIYGTDCPGMASLGDIKSLQIEEKRKAQAIDKMVNPPLRGPAALQNVPINSLPGGTTLYDGADTVMKLGPLYEVNPQLQELRIDMDAIERRIDKLFFTDLFQAISNMEGIQPRNQFDLIQRKEESLVQLGPVLDRLHGEFLKPLIEKIFSQAVRAGILPPAPPVLGDAVLDVKFISNLAMAQRALDTQTIDRLTAFVLQYAAVDPSVLDKLDGDQAIDEYAKALGTPPKLVRPDDIVEERRKQQQQAQQLQQMAEIAKTGATAAKIGAEAENVATGE